MQNKVYIFLLSCFVHTIQCRAQSNIGFEQTIPGVYTTSSAVTGWTVESTTNLFPNIVACTGTASSWSPGSPEFSLVATPIFAIPYVAGNPFSIDNVTIPNSPLGGNNIVRLQDGVGTSSLVTRLRTTFQVTTLNSSFQLAYAGSWDGAQHSCCDRPFFNFRVYNCSGIAVNTLSLNLTPIGPSCLTGAAGYTISGSPLSVQWCNWLVSYIDLSQFIGSCVTLEILNGDCNGADHHGSLYFDAKTSYGGSFVLFPANMNQVNLGKRVNYCSGSNQARIFAPLGGYVSYQWYAPNHPNPPILISPTLGGNSQVVTLPNPIPGTVYTVQMVTASGFSFNVVDTLQFSSVSIIGIGSNSTSCGGATGSATVVGNGSGTGYNYNWYAPGNISIGTGSVVSGLAQGVYTVGVSALGSAGCGSAVTTVTVGTTNVSTSVKYYCGNGSNLAYLSAAPTASNIQWYSGLSAISPTLGGTAQNYTVTFPYNNQFFWLSYNSSLTCRDSVKIILTPAPSIGSVSVSYNKLICAGANNGQVVFSLTPSVYSPSVTNSFSVFTTGISGTFSLSPFPSPSTSFTVNNLSANNSYSVNASDGFCQYTTTLNVNVFSAPNYTLSPSSLTVCQGGTVAAGVTFNPPSLASQHSYTWTPNTFLFGNNANNQTTIITPVAALGTINNIVYTVVVTPTLLNCPSSQTISMTYVNLATPTISAIPPLCVNSPNYTITVTPSGGFFSGSIVGFSNGIITPSLVNVGTKFFVYSLMPGTCVSNASNSFTVNALPIISISGGTAICEGKATTLYASGANSYLWNTNTNGSTLGISPIVPTIYSVVGTNTLTSCSNIASYSVDVIPLPILSLTGKQSICEGETTTIFISGANSYYQWSNGSTSNSITVSPGGTTSYSVLGGNTTTCENSKTVTIVVSPCTGISELNNADESLKIYPNPTDGKLFIELKSPSILTIYNELGSVIFEGPFKNGRHTVDLSNYGSGIYLLKCTLKEKSKIVKVIKTN